MSSYNEKFQELLQQNNPIGIFAYWYLKFAEAITMPVYALLRRNFGERYFSLSTIIIYVIVFWVASDILDGVDIGNAIVWWSFTGLLGVLSFYHAFTIWNRNRKGIRWHSRYDGDSLLDILPGSGELVRMVYEPIFVLILAIVIMVHVEVHFLGEWLLLCVGFMIFLQRLKQSAARDMYLNAVDSQIESAQMAAMLAGEPARKSEGYVVHGISDVSSQKRNKMLGVLKKGFDTIEKKAAQPPKTTHVINTVPTGTAYKAKEN